MTAQVRKNWMLMLGMTALIGVVSGSTLFLFQNCAPDQYFEAKKNIDETSAASMAGSSRFFITTGELRSTDAGRAAGLTILGRAVMVRDSLTGRTETYVHVTGLPQSITNMSHVHDLPCNLGGGGHYKIDYSIAAALESNEIWPTIVSGADGAGSGRALAAHYARPEAQAVVIHNAANARMACGKLHSSSGSTTKGGMFTLFAAGQTAVPNLRGTAILIRDGANAQSIVRLSVNGMASNQAYMAHVHNQACNNADGGPHYKINPEITEVTASAANELWPLFTTNITGHGEVRLAVPHVARADALSIVIHDPALMTTRFACVDLSLDAGFVPTEVGIQRMPSVFGTGKLERLTNGSTKASVSISGLTANTMYMMHVHDRPCHINAGGGHYKFDYSIAAALESNEIWLRVNTDAVGAGTATTTVQHLARAEAYSIVAHDADNTRLACLDLY
ncbi:MAG: hypothetical protein AB7N80_14575 [Bdellovibrionales bacterium]